MSAVNKHHERKRPRLRLRTPRQLGLVEYALLSLIALGVTVTFVMAIVNP